MRLLLRDLLVFVSLCALSGCAHKSAKPPPAARDSGIPATYPNFTKPVGTPVVGGGNAPSQIPVTPQEDIVWTDPDHPDAKPAQLESLLDTPKGKAWEESDTEARKQAMRQCRPLLIWFTDSANNALCNALSTELFSTEPFDKWVADKFVRLRVDANIRNSDPKLNMDQRTDREARLRDYIEAMRKRYKVLGQPTVVVVTPDGAVVSRYRGYHPGNSEIFWGLIRQGEVAASKSSAEWRASMEKKGYRQWQDRRGRMVFAKLLAYAKGELLLLEPDGQRARTTESKLCDADQSWLAKEKAARGVH